MAQLEHLGRTEGQESSDISEKAKAFDGRGVLAPTQGKVDQIVLSPTPLEAQLESMPEIFSYLSIEAINEALKELPGIRVEIPEAEINRLKSLLPTELSVEQISEIKKVQTASKGDQGLLVMQLPQEILVDGRMAPFTIANLIKIIRIAAAADYKMFTPVVTKLTTLTAEIANKQWPSDLTARSLSGLEGTDGKNSAAQRRDRIDILGPGYEVEADMFLAVALQCIASREVFMDLGHVNLNTQLPSGAGLGVLQVPNGAPALIRIAYELEKQGRIGAALNLSQKNY